MNEFEWFMWSYVAGYNQICTLTPLETTLNKIENVTKNLCMSDLVWEEVDDEWYHEAFFSFKIRQKYKFCGNLYLVCERLYMSLIDLDFVSLIQPEVKILTTK